MIGRSQIFSNIARGNGVERVCFRRQLIESGLSGHDNIADVQGLVDVMRMQNRTMPLTIAFYVAFALWFTAISHSFPSFYGWHLAPVVGRILVFGTTALFCTVVVLAAWRGFRTLTFPRVDFTVLGCAILGFDLVWRLYLSRFAWDAFKLISIALDVATPAIAILGMFVVISEWKRSGQVMTKNELFNG